jgi:hypothetical protein
MTQKDYPAGNAREPILRPVPIDALRPTQITVGMREVAARRNHWKRQTTEDKRAQFLQKHLIPVILGPKNGHYIIDHHHLALALHQERIKDVYITVVADLSALDKDTFWFVLDQRDWMHPFDKKGQRCSPKKIPAHVTGLKDDPYRSLAGELRRAGGFAKDTTPYSEFLWADFLRKRVKVSQIEKSFSKALALALRLARSKQAQYLPGWCGPNEG